MEMKDNFQANGEQMRMIENIHARGEQVRMNDNFMHTVYRS